MCHLFIVSGILVSFGTIAVSDSLGGGMTYADSEFLESAWTATKVYDSTPGEMASFWSAQSPQGGNPGAFRRISITFNYPGYPALVNVAVANISDAALYAPSTQGAISSIDYSIDDAFLSEIGGSTTIAYECILLQNDTYYSAARVYDYFLSWTKHSFVGLTASDFSRLAGPGASYPDFTTTGAPMQFGYACWSGGGTGAPTTIIIDGGVDNWSVTVNSVPEPSALVLIGIAALGVLAYAGTRWLVS
jgi:hypothetical protein